MQPDQETPAADTFTPGPWIATTFDQGDFTDVEIEAAANGARNAFGDFGRHITATCWAKSYATRKADAALIAAAPCMLAALRDLLASYTKLVDGGDCGFWDAGQELEVIAARAAIAKATTL